MPDESSAVAAAPAAGEVNVSQLASGAPEPAGANFNESFAELEAAMGEESHAPSPSKEVPKADPKPKSSASNADKKSPDPKNAKSEAQPSQDAKETGQKDQNGEETNGKPLPAPELRKAYQELKTKHAQLQKEYETFKATPREDPQAKTLAEKLAAAEKHRQQLDEELKHAAYERSQEFKERYHQPFVNAYELASEVATQLQVTDAEGNIRQGTKEDFDYLMQIADTNAAKKWAEDLYGPAGAAILMNQRMEVVKHARARNTALVEAQKMAGEREKTRLEVSQAQQKALSEKWTKLNNEAQERYPDWFKPTEGDDKGNQLLESGYKMADIAFSGAEMPPEKQVELHSAIRNRAAAFGREAYLHRKAKARITELEAELESYKASEPGPGEGKTDGKAEPDELNWEKRLESQWAT